MSPPVVLGEFPRYRGVDTGLLLSVIKDGRWANSDDSGRLCVTKSGQALLEAESPAHRLRLQLRTLIDLTSPPWATAVVQGRSAFARYLPPEVAQCFRECGLLESQEPDIVAWWDSLSARRRHDTSAALLETGREGERLSVRYELERTGCHPYWIALEYCDAGYDILSRTSRAAPQKLLIEVKASRMEWSDAQFHLSRNEWDVLSSAQAAQVHLWTIRAAANGHAIVPVQRLTPHIPVEPGSARWETAEFPFAAFRDCIVDHPSG